MTDDRDVVDRREFLVALAALMAAAAARGVPPRQLLDEEADRRD